MLLVRVAGVQAIGLDAPRLRSSLPGFLALPLPPRAVARRVLSGPVLLVDGLRSAATGNLGTAVVPDRQRGAVWGHLRHGADAGVGVLAPPWVVVAACIRRACCKARRLQARPAHRAVQLRRRCLRGSGSVGLHSARPRRRQRRAPVPRCSAREAVSSVISSGNRGKGTKGRPSKDRGRGTPLRGCVGACLCRYVVVLLDDDDVHGTHRRHIVGVAYGHQLVGCLVKTEHASLHATDGWR